MTDHTKRFLKATLSGLEEKRTEYVRDLEHYKNKYESTNENLNSLEASIKDIRDIMSLKLEDEPKGD